MEQILQPSWWLSFFSTIAPWWLFCTLVAIVAFPLTLRVFRGLADRGAGLASGFGIILVTYIAQVIGTGWFGASKGATTLRLILLAGAFLGVVVATLAGTRGWVLGKRRTASYIPALLLGFIGLVHLPHSPVGIYGSVLLLLIASIAAWWGDGEGFRRAASRNLVPGIVGWLIFTIALFFFANVRSYLPYATFERGLYQAEKFGNYTHLQSVMQSDTMPPKDVWFSGYPINYYYGGHLLSGTIAKATGTPTRIAFNLGLATLFAMTMSMGFSFAFGMTHLVTRKFRITRRFIWHRGMAWGVLGALAIGMFGNLDSWRQIFQRDLDFGVRARWEAHRRVEGEEWKLRTGISASGAATVVAMVNDAPPYQRPERAIAELRRLTTTSADTPGQLELLAKAAEQALDTTAGAPARERENAVWAAVLDGRYRPVFDAQTSQEGAKLEGRLFDMLRERKFDAVPGELRAIAKQYKDPSKGLNDLGDKIRARMDATLGEPSVKALAEFLANPLKSPAVEAVLPGDAQKQAADFRDSVESKNYSRIGELLALLQTTAEKNVELGGTDGIELRRLLGEANAKFRVDPLQIMADEWHGLPPTYNRNPTISDLRFTWENMTFINFWEPSRAIKGAPPGTKEPMTITEFPYFSAILGDHHPHHFAIPYTLGALCACLSLLRKNGRRKGTDIDFLFRSFPELIAMGFFIGSVFCVNTWDSLILGPTYALVVLVAWKGVRVGEGWRWVGFLGFSMLLMLLVGILYNSIPGVTPLFQNAIFFLAALGVLGVGYPVARAMFFGLPAKLVALGLLAIAAGLVFAGGMTSNAGGAEVAVSHLHVALRDLAMFLILVGIAAQWSLRGSMEVHRWWYSAGAVYAFVGGSSLIFILPYKLFATTPLQPAMQLFYDILPPFLSYEMKAPNMFWSTFWQTIPINPFPQNLRTELGDFIVHWGIFLLTIVPFIIVRFWGFSKGRQPGFSFMVAMLALAVFAVALNYLGFWTGPLSIAAVVFCAAYAFSFGGKMEGPAWVFLTAAFFWTWFAEALHFDDDMAGNLERYNSLFKIYYPVWHMMAVGAVVALKVLLGNFTIKERNAERILSAAEFWTLLAVFGIAVPYFGLGLFPETLVRFWFYAFWIWAVVLVLILLFGRPSSTRRRILLAEASDTANRLLARWPAFAVGAFLLVLGLHYPLGATLTRSREFFTYAPDGFMRQPEREIFLNRTLDGLEHFVHFPLDAQDYKAALWLEKNKQKGEFVLEVFGDGAYQPEGRIATESGLTTVIGWRHHENQWRGRAIQPPHDMKQDFLNQAAIDNTPLPITGLDLAFRTLVPEAPTLTAKEQLAIRMAPPKKQLAILRDMFPKSDLMMLYRLRRLISLNDINMNIVMDQMIARVTDMYTSPDAVRVKKLIGLYGVDYVVVGALERQKFPAVKLDERFTGFGFQLVYDSSAKENLLPFEDYEINEPTRVYKVPDGFGTLPKVEEDPGVTPAAPVAEVGK